MIVNYKGLSETLRLYA